MCPELNSQSGALALTSAQIPIWIDQSIFPQKPIYNTGQTLRLRTALDVDRFLEALDQVVAENDALRLRFVESDDLVHQEVMDEVAVNLAYRDFSNHNDPESAAQAWIEQLFWKPFRPDDCPLFHFAVAKVGSYCFLWLQKYHHLVIDAVGRRLVAASFAEIYDSCDSLSVGSAAPDPEPRSYRRLIELEEQYRRSRNWATDEAYWRTRFSDAPDALVRTHPDLSEKDRSGRPVRLNCDLPRSSSDALRNLAQRHGLTVFKVIVGLVWCCFSRLYGNSDLVFGVPVANRRTPWAKKTVGLFAKVMPFRLRLDLAADCADALSTIDSALLRDLAHQAFPGDQINRLARSKGYSARSLYDAVINHQRNDYGFLLGGSPVTCSNISVGFAVPWSITAFEHKSDGDVDIVIDYDPGRVQGEEAQRFLHCLREMLRHAPECSETPLGRLPMVSSEERAALILRGQGPNVPIPEDATLATLFDRQAARSPNATAIICGEERLSYVELHSRVDALARVLRSRDVGPDILVGVCLPRTVNLVVGVLAIHKAGGAYLPLDPNYPAERLAHMVQDSQTRIILTDRTHSALVAEPGAAEILLDELDLKSSDGVFSFEAGNGVEQKNYAYVIYTSGSTGRPKGVAVTHRSAVNLLLASKELIGSEDISGVLFSTPLSFDISVYEIFLPLACGGAIILVDSLFAPESAPGKSDVRLINTVPSLMNTFLTEAKLPDAIRVVNLAGEPLPHALADKLFIGHPELRIFNLYGPTETAVYSTWSCVKPEDGRPPPIGFPFANTRLYVLDEFLEPMPDGIVGELWIGGAGVAQGYINQPELTAQRFVPNPFGSDRLYRTGDLVRWLPDGQLDFCGRVDHQVKINGVRIELSEVEECLRSHAAVSAAAVVGEEQAGQKKLVAYLVARSGVSWPTDSAIRKHVRSSLPLAFIPARFVWLGAFPVTSSGKNDRKALGALNALVPAAVSSAHRRPRDPIEEAISTIWQEDFNEAIISLDDNYFELGGDSLGAFWVIHRCNKRFGTDLPLSFLFRHPTMEQLADGIRAALGQGSSAKRRETTSDAAPVVAFMPGAGGDNQTLTRFRAGFGTKVRFLSDRVSILARFDQGQSGSGCNHCVRY
jgi:amino acid adenylation domain-containing protein